MPEQKFCFLGDEGFLPTLPNDSTFLLALSCFLVNAAKASFGQQLKRKGWRCLKIRIHQGTAPTALDPTSAHPT